MGCAKRLLSIERRWFRAAGTSGIRHWLVQTARFVRWRSFYIVDSDWQILIEEMESIRFF